MYICTEITNKTQNIMVLYFLIEIKQGNTYTFYAGKSGNKILQFANPFKGKRYMGRKCAENAVEKLKQIFNKPGEDVKLKQVNDTGTIN